MKLLLTLIFFSILTSEAQGNKTSAKISREYKEFYNTIRQQFIIIDSLVQVGGYDSLEKANDNVINIINKFKAKLFDFLDSLNYDLLYLAKSKDKKFVLISWDTRMGGTMIDFTTMAIYKTNQGIKSKMLVDTTDENMPHTYMHYNSINTITTLDGKKIYLACGNGQGSTALPWQEIRAFSIAKERLFEPKIFPASGSKIFIEFDLHDFKENERVPVIRVKDNGNIIQVPIEGNKQGFSGKYKTYIFNGKVFQAK